MAVLFVRISNSGEDDNDFQSAANNCCSINGGGIITGSISTSFCRTPVTIPPGDFVVDNAQVLGGNESKLENDIKTLRDDTGISLFIVYVDEFTSPSNPGQWLEQVAANKNMGSSDAILVVATKQRQANFAGHQNGPLSAYTQEIYSKQISPALAKKDWSGAAEGAIEGIANVADGGSATSSSSSGGGVFWVLLIIGGVAVAGYVILSRRSKKKTNQILKETQALGNPSSLSHWRACDCERTNYLLPPMIQFVLPSRN